MRTKLDSDIISRAARARLASEQARADIHGYLYGNGPSSFRGEAASSKPYGEFGPSSDAGPRHSGESSKHTKSDFSKYRHSYNVRDSAEFGGDFSSDFDKFWQDCMSGWDKRMAAEKRNFEENMRNQAKREYEYTSARNRRDYEAHAAREKARREARGNPYASYHSQSDHAPPMFNKIRKPRKTNDEAKRGVWEVEWEAFSRAAKEVVGSIKYSDVPWLPAECNVSGVSESDTAAQRKRKFRDAMLRWHPDKFVSNFGSALSEAEVEPIMRRVTEIAAALFEEIEAWNYT